MLEGVRQQWTGQWSNLLTSGGHLLLLLVGFQIGEPAGWMAVFGLIAAIGFFAWIGNYRRLRLMADTPTSRVASAAQGHVELFGNARQHPGHTLLSKLTGLPCLWFYYLIERRNSDNKWVREDSGCSDDTFLLADDSGECIIDPDFAEITSRHNSTWIKGDYRYTERLLLPQEKIYAIGEFTSVGGAGSPLDMKEDVGALLAEWKHDRVAMLERFDLDRDGEIDEREWMLARAQAQREVQVRHREIRAQDSSHILRKPRDGRPFLISNIAPHKLLGRYRFWSAFHLAVFFIAVGGTAYMLAR
jgi:hypothetical protein